MKATVAFIATCCLALTSLDWTRASPITIEVPPTRVLTQADYRLERFIVPESYKVDLTLNTDFHSSKAFTIDECEISFNLNEAETPADKKQIRIHYGVDFKSDAVSLVGVDGIAIAATIETPATLTDIAVITIAEDLVAAKMPYKLKFTGLTGTLQEDMSGFYLSEYMVGTDKKYIATTQFQSTDARKAFPCFDEPFFKATFDISINRPSSYTTVLGNTPMKTDVENGVGMKRITFGTTPIMSTYLVAFIVSTLDKIEHATYGIYFPEGLKPAGQFAFEITPKIINDLGTKLGKTYPQLGNTQLHQAAIPDFSAGAMENWGLATYRETALLWDPTHSTARNKQRVASVIAHEIAHMWFGDYVTMDWWSETWLNEGFARYFEYHTTANVETDWDMESQFLVEQQQVIFNNDAVSSAQPLTSKVEDIYTPAQVSSKFGSITYNKGGSVLRMIERAMGRDNFFTALKSYLVKYALKNTLSPQLIQEFQALGLRQGVTDEWIKEPGYPVVTVTKRNNDAVLTQKRFLVDDSTSNMKWDIPITFATRTVNADFSDTKATAWFLKTTNEHVLENALTAASGYIVVNVQGSGYYRVNYDATLWETISTTLRDDINKIHKLNRAQLIDDSMNLARIGTIHYDVAMGLSRYLENEVEYIPWVSAFNAFSFLNKRFGNNAELSTWFKEYVLKISNKLYNSVSFTPGMAPKHVDLLKTALALQWACEMGATDCIAKSTQLFSTYMATPTVNAINPNVRSVVYCNAIRNGAKAQWTFLNNQFKTSNVASEKVTIIAALGCSKDKTVLADYLLMSLDDTQIRKQDAYSVFTAVLAGNVDNLDVAFNFLTTKFSTISNSYASMNALSNIFNALADRFTTTKQVTDFNTFLTTNAAELGEDNVKIGQNAVKTATANIAWTTKFESTFKDWLSRERGAAPAITAGITIVVAAALITMLY